MLRPAAHAAELDSPPGIHEFAERAMAARFRIRVVEPDPRYARQAAGAAFEVLELLDRLLSRFDPASDISRINGLAAGQRTVVALETFACLRIAERWKRETGGAFDVAYLSETPAHEAGFRLDPAKRSVQVTASGVRLDLGGIGKGFALDRMAAVLREWDIRAAMLWASTSTVLAFGRPQRDEAWAVDFGTARDRRQRELRGGAFSGSGTAIRGRHVVDAKSGRRAAAGRRSWAAAPTAAVADAVSTALMVMPPAGIQRLCRQHPKMTAYVAHSDKDGLAVFGNRGVRRDELRLSDSHT
jgi:thiamine biosynthesis lipoprotein